MGEKSTIEIFGQFDVFAQNETIGASSIPESLLPSTEAFMARLVTPPSPSALYDYAHELGPGLLGGYINPLCDHTCASAPRLLIRSTGRLELANTTNICWKGEFHLENILVLQEGSTMQLEGTGSVAAGAQVVA